MSTKFPEFLGIPRMKDGAAHQLSRKILNTRRYNAAMVARLTLVKSLIFDSRFG